MVLTNWFAVDLCIVKIDFYIIKCENFVGNNTVLLLLFSGSAHLTTLDTGKNHHKYFQL